MFIIIAIIFTLPFAILLYVLVDIAHDTIEYQNFTYKAKPYNIFRGKK